MMTKRKTNIKKIKLPDDFFVLDDSVVATSAHRLRRQNKDIIVTANTDDTGVLISRVAALLDDEHSVFIKTDDNWWERHFYLVGEAVGGYAVYSRRPERSDIDVQQATEVAEPVEEDPEVAGDCGC